MVCAWLRAIVVVIVTLIVRVIVVVIIIYKNEEITIQGVHGEGLLIPVSVISRIKIICDAYPNV